LLRRIVFAILFWLACASGAAAIPGEPPICRNAETDAALTALFQSPGSRPASVAFELSGSHNVQLEFDEPRLQAEVFNCLEAHVADDSIQAHFSVEGERIAPPQSRLIADIVRTLFAVADANAIRELRALIDHCQTGLPASFDVDRKRKAFPVYDRGFAAQCEIGLEGERGAKRTAIDITKSDSNPQHDRWATARSWEAMDSARSHGPLAWRNILKPLVIDKEGATLDKSIATLVAAASREAKAGGATIIGNTRCDTRRFFAVVRALGDLGLHIQQVSFQSDMMTISTDMKSAGIGVFALECLSGQPPAILWGLGAVWDLEGRAGSAPPQLAKLPAAKRDAIAALIAGDLRGNADEFRAGFAKCLKAEGNVELQAGGLGVHCFEDSNEGVKSRLVLTTGASR